VKGEPIDDEGTEMVCLNMGQVKITFLDPTGKPATVGTPDIRKCGFVVEGPGIDPLRVRRVIIPPLDYSSPDLLTIKIEMYPGDMGLGD